MTEPRSRHLPAAIALAALIATATDARAADLVVGPDASSDEPFVIDTVGEMETTFRALGTPSTRSKPSRWQAELEVLVHAPDIAADDALLLQVMRGGKRLGKSFPCQLLERFGEIDAAFFRCLAPGERGDYESSFSTAGRHTLSLSYRRVVAGVEHRDFARFELDVIKLAQGAQNNPYVAWSTDHDRKLAVTTIEEKTESSSSRANANIHNAIDAAARKKNVPYLALRTWFKRERGLEGSRATCFHGDKKVAEAASSGGRRFDYWSHSKRGREQVSWHQATYLLYALRPNAGPGGGKGSWATPQHWMHENPGAYCPGSVIPRQSHGFGCAVVVRVAKRAIDSRISSALLVHLKGFGSSLWASR